VEREEAGEEVELELLGLELLVTRLLDDGGVGLVGGAGGG